MNKLRSSCLFCGYGSADALICPECGRSLSPNVIEAELSLRMRCWRSVWWILLILGILGGTFACMEWYIAILDGYDTMFYSSRVQYIFGPLRWGASLIMLVGWRLYRTIGLRTQKRTTIVLGVLAIGLSCTGLFIAVFS